MVAQALPPVNRGWTTRSGTGTPACAMRLRRKLCGTAVARTCSAGPRLLTSYSCVFMGGQTAAINGEPRRGERSWPMTIRDETESVGHDTSEQVP